MTPPASRVRTRFFRIIRSRPAQTAGLLAVISALSLTALHPLMFGALPASPDGPLHLYRLVALDHAVRHGLLWPRYLPGMLYGYGVPLFNYYSPLYLYPSELFRLAGLSFVNSLLAGLALYMLLGALGAYLLGRAWNGPVAGIGVAGAYLYAPYLLYEALRRGVLAQYAALAILPWVLWAFWRTARQGRRRDLLLAVICYSLLILMHNITGAVRYGLAGGLLPLFVVDQPRSAACLPAAGCCVDPAAGTDCFFLVARPGRDKLCPYRACNALCAGA